MRKKNAQIIGDFSDANLTKWTLIKVTPLLIPWFESIYDGWMEHYSIWFVPPFVHGPNDFRLKSVNKQLNAKLLCFTTIVYYGHYFKLDIDWILSFSGIYNFCTRFISIVESNLSIYKWCAWLFLASLQLPRVKEIFTNNNNNKRQPVWHTRFGMNGEIDGNHCVCEITPLWNVQMERNYPK